MNNIEINNKLETDIENKYIKYKENVKFTTEEAIYILKRKDFCDEVENIAIENLIQENKELKEKTDKAINMLEKHIQYCEQEAKGSLNNEVCNIALRFDKHLLQVLKGE